MNGNPMATHLSNTMGRGSGDNAYRDQIGDMTDGAMGTHIGNQQSTSSNYHSDYNQANQTDIQKNINMIDAVRGYGQDSRDDDNIFSSLSMNSAHHDASADMSNDIFSSLSMNSAHNNDLKPSYGPSSMQPTSIGERQVMVEVASNIMEKKPQIIYIDTSLNKDVEKKYEDVPDSVNNTIRPTSSKLAPSGSEKKKAKDKTKNNADVDYEEEEEEIRPRGSKSSGDSVQLRPIKPPSRDSSSFAPLEKKSKEDILADKLARLSDDEFLELLENTSRDSDSDNLDTKILAGCKLILLKKEATRRHDVAKFQQNT